MGTRDPRFDAYIEKSAEFAQPILRELRDVVHAACPDAEETMKWSMPHFMYHGMFCGMAAFKQHCTFGFWKGKLIVGSAADEEAMGQFGCIRSLKDLPSRKKMTGYIKVAMKLNEEGVKLPKTATKKAAKPAPVEPKDFLARLKANRKAQKTYDAFSPSHRREYVNWITEAKTEATRERRLAQALEWMAEGKSRNWKYQNC